MLLLRHYATMYIRRPLYPFVKGITICLFLLAACTDKKKGSETITQTPRELQAKASDLIQETVESAVTANGNTGDSGFILAEPRTTWVIYNKNGFEPAWSKERAWLARADSLFGFIESSRLFGLFPEDYHVSSLKEIREKFLADSLSKKEKKDAALWAKADIMLTDAFARIIHDVKLGRLPQDSITLRKDSVLSDEFYLQQFEKLNQGGISSLISSLEPNQRGYHLLKAGIKRFLDSADYREYTIVPYPVKDTNKFKITLQRRLYEEGYFTDSSGKADSAQLAAAIKRFQQKKGIAVDGKAGEGTVRMLNSNDRERFVRIAISLDKYKMLPETMPPKYIWVNVSSNYLEVVDKDSVKLLSKVICGKPKTRTPLLTSSITELITYPQWVPPPSIVQKEILPAVKKNPGYLAKKGFSLVDKEGNEVDPYTVDWSKYSKGIPYRVVQGSGDANALGILKFVFSNKYSVYLHDTNQRYLFANAMRNLSHGCVRVQEWEKLTWYLLRNDSLNAGGRGYTRIDSVKSWLQQKQKRSIALRNRIPVFLRNFTCEGRDGRIVFFDDVYAEDKKLREKYFAAK